MFRLAFRTHIQDVTCSQATGAGPAALTIRAEHSYKTPGGATAMLAYGASVANWSVGAVGSALPVAGAWVAQGHAPLMALGYHPPPHQLAAAPRC
jgi:hypothetical protein